MVRPPLEQTMHILNGFLYQVKHSVQAHHLIFGDNVLWEMITLLDKD